MDSTTEIINRVGALSYAGIFGISFLANIFVPVPEEIVILAIGYVAGTGRINFWITLPIVIVGALISDLMMFELARRGNKLVQGIYDKFFRLVVPLKREFVAEHITKVIFVARFLVNLRFLGPFLAGQEQVSHKRFIAVDTAALVVYVSFLMWAGHYFQNRIESVFAGAGAIKNIILVLIGVIIIWSIGQMVKKLFVRDFIISFKSREGYEKTKIPGVHRAVKSSESTQNNPQNPH